MIKKILLTLITVFAFSNVNAQDPILSTVSDCTASGQLVISEHLFVIIENGKNSYERTSTPSLDAQALGVPTGQAENTGIRYSSTNTRWELWGGSNINFVVFYAPDNGELFPPANGWIADATPCSFVSASHVVDGSVLNLTREELSENSKINVYPNPSVDFISISNLKDAVQCRITNIAGQTVLSKVVDANDNQMDVQELSKGFYFVEIAGKKTLKFIKK
tara:strand:- start:142 stop:801 length:660 start_codon:yes stop_codon:yes gene_type:complete